MIDFTSISTQLSGKGGQGSVFAANGGLISDITVSIAAGFAFKDLIINPFKPAIADNIFVSALLTNGQTVGFAFNNTTTGNQFLTLVATGSALIKKVTITSSGGFQVLKQTRISGVVPAVVPEPSSLLLFGSGLLGLAVTIRRKKLS
jgi:hypothetical protein